MGGTRNGIRLNASAERRLDQFPAVDVFNVIALDLLESIGEDPHQLEILFFLRDGLAWLGRFDRSGGGLVVVVIVIIVDCPQSAGRGEGERNH